MATPLWMRVLLLASLALNLLVAGVLVGDALTDGGPGHGPRPVALDLGPLTRALDPADRRAVLDALQGRDDLRPPSRAERAAFLAETLAAVRADPFDRARAEAALLEQSERVAAVEGAVRAALLDRLAALPAEARDAYADRLEAEAGRGPGHD